MGIKILIISTISCFFLFIQPEVQQKDIFDTLSVYFKDSNSKDIAAYFESVIELDILSEEGEYSKAQAELILRDFFSRHSAVSVKVLHRLSSSSNYKFGVLSFESKSKKLRVSISMANNGNKFLIKTITIENDKE
ncbi:MAG: DUF4783 domain-containing protein [Daejeonella sp.]|uniref:DUF4783 domain-containing protein n=1 Tax=Daejeonella sp. TaxID=2805397 RepID=UPI0027367D14|nr:DUF4783 domain-containing protein [Daejeonella sp.]MDP3470162.1 DUF4783 domain-containing protein [Daejeonella sp.]